MKLARFVVSLLVSLTSMAALAGPFGLEMGMTVAQLKAAGVNVSNFSSGALDSVTVPRPHPAFQHYVMLVDDKTGLCKVAAIGKDVVMNSYGTQLISEFESLRDGLDQTYGKGKTRDYLNNGSIWSEKKDWAMGLLKKERVLASYWGTKFSGSQFIAKDNVSVVAMEAIASSSSEGYLSLQYEFSNAQGCVASRQKKTNSVL